MARQHLALIVDDNPMVLEAAQEIVTSLGHAFVTASSQQEAEAKLRDVRPCYMLIDLELPVRAKNLSRLQTGLNLLTLVRGEFAPEEMPVIVMTAHGDDHALAVRAFKHGATDFVKKPFDDDFEPLEDKIRNALAKTCELRAACARDRQDASDVGPLSAAPAEEQAAAPPSEVVYRCSHTLRFHGEVRKRRYRLDVDGTPVWVRLSTLEVLWRLAARMLSDGPEWVRGDDLHASYHSAISRMRKDLRERAGLNGDLLDNDGHGSFRLSVPPANISFDEAVFAAEHPGLFGLLTV